jgi:hypothetical protein
MLSMLHLCYCSFKDQPDFRPNLTPAEVLQMGSFGGTYFRPIRSGVTQQSYKNVHKEFPDEWFEGLNIAKEVTSSKYDIKLNRYKVKSGTDLADWEKSGWISALGNAKNLLILYAIQCCMRAVIVRSL